MPPQGGQGSIYLEYQTYTSAYLFDTLVTRVEGEGRGVMVMVMATTMMMVMLVMMTMIMVLYEVNEEQSPSVR